MAQAGRPKSLPVNKGSAKINLYLTKRIYEQLQGRADKSLISVTALVRTWIAEKLSK